LLATPPGSDLDLYFDLAQEQRWPQATLVLERLVLEKADSQ